MPEDNLIRNHILLTPNGEYKHPLLKLCERYAQREKKVLLVSQQQAKLTDMLEKPASLHHLQHWLHIMLKDIESAPRRIIELYDMLPRPSLIVFDMNSIISELISRPVLQQCSNEILVRYIAKCAAAFCNFREMIRVTKKKNDISTGWEDVVNVIVILPSETYPLSSAQFKLLIGLYFSDYQLSTNFNDLSRHIFSAQNFQ